MGAAAGESGREMPGPLLGRWQSSGVRLRPSAEGAGRPRRGLGLLGKEREAPQPGPGPGLPVPTEGDRFWGQGPPGRRRVQRGNVQTLPQRRTF